MDKVTRILMLYSKLIRGEIINKVRFCLEMECQFRSFDRDIEDIRLFLSESYSIGELCYDRRVGGYLLTEAVQPPLENTEYSLVEKVMSDSKILRKDEMDELLYHIALHTENVMRATDQQKYAIDQYDGPTHGKPLLKLFEDLNTAIGNHKVIRIHGEQYYLERDIIPCGVYCQDKKLWLTALDTGEEAQDLRISLEEIESFIIIRNQSAKEKELVENHIKNESGGIHYGNKKNIVSVRDA